MKDVKWLGFIFCASLLLIQLFGFVPKDKLEIKKSKTSIALLIGIDAYPTVTGWNQLHSTNDIDLIKQVLIDQGFKASNITQIKDKAATRKGILAAIEEELIGKAKEGATAIFHFSGHGQQIKDDNGDELDGYDEAIVPINSNKYFSPGSNEGERLIRDDELETAFTRLRKKLGPKGHLLILIDACHSGTVTRNFFVTRGTNVVMADDAYIAQNKTRGTKNSNTMISNQKGEDLAPMVCFFSSGAQELSYEFENDQGNHYGLLSYAFSKTMKKAKKETSYQELFDQMKMEVTSYTNLQTPQYEGDLSLGILNEEAIGIQDYYVVNKKVGPGVVTLVAGTINGIHKNTTFEFYPLDVETDELHKIKPMTTGTVIYSDLFECDVQLTKNFAEEEIKKTKVLVKEKNYGNLSIKVKLDIGNKLLYDSIKSQMMKLPFVELVETSADLHIEAYNGFVKGDQLQIIRPDGTSIINEDISEDKFENPVHNIKHKVLQFTQSQFLKKLNIATDGFKIKVDFLSASNDELIPPEDWQFKIGIPVKMRLTNIGQVSYYFSVLNIQSDFKINCVIPFSRTAEEYHLEPGQSYIFEELLTAQPPTGQEIFKMILTHEPIDLSNLIAKRGLPNQSNDNKHPLEILLSQTYLDSNTRGESTINIQNGSVGVFTVPFEIVE